MPNAFVAALALFAVIVANPIPTAAQRSLPGRPVAITNVTVIDVATGEHHERQTVVIRGSRIADVGDTGELAVVPSGAVVVDGRGKYLIPGLWDMHVHLGDRAETGFPLLLAHGVTGVRDLHMPLRNATARAVALRDDVTTNRVLGPRLVVGTIVAGPEGARGDATTLVARSPDEGRAVVRSLESQGADLVKVYSQLDRQTYFAILAEAKRARIPVDGHVAFSLGAGEASDSGQRTVEHLEDGGVLSGCTARDSAFRAEILQAQRAPVSPRRRASVVSIFRRMSDAIDEPTCRALGARLARNGTAFTPTLLVERLALDRFDLPPLTADERKYAPAKMQRWRDSVRTAIRRDTGAVWQRHFRRQLAIVPIMQRAGAILLAGTDFGPDGYPVPGISLHQELALLVEAGLSPLEALQAATINPARALGATDLLGSVSRGKIADLVLLDDDPTLDIAYASRVRAVFANGRYLDRSALSTALSGFQ